MKVAVLGAGAWGTAISISLAPRHAVTLWARDAEQALDIATTRVNQLYLPAFTIPAHGMTYWVGEAMHKVDYQDLEHRPAKTREATKMAARNAAHLARVVRRDGYPKATT